MISSAFPKGIHYLTNIRSTTEQTYSKNFPSYLSFYHLNNLLI